MAYGSSKAQGWYSDPFHQHGARWFSDGTPTALVRDSGVESEDPPPETWYADNLVPPPATEGVLFHGR